MLTTNIQIDQKRLLSLNYFNYEALGNLINGVREGEKDGILSTAQSPLLFHFISPKGAM